MSYFENGILVSGLRRSGNHAIINWIMAHYPETSHHVGVFHANNVHTFSDRERKNREGPFVLISVEDYGIADVEKGIVDSKWSTWIRNPPQLKIAVLRSLYNMVASRVVPNNSYMTRAAAMTPEILELWKQYARMAMMSFVEWHVVLFDQWFEEEPYRRVLERRLSLPCETDGDMDYVDRAGSGSSFDKRKIPGSQMDVLYRYEHPDVQIPDYVLEDREAAALNLELFGWKL